MQLRRVVFPVSRRYWRRRSVEGKALRAAPPGQSLRAAVLWAMAMPLGCAYCGADGGGAPPAAGSLMAPGPGDDPEHSGMAQAGRLPAGLDLPRGNCGADMFLSTDSRCVPLRWHCPPAYFAGGAQDGCDCNCGAVDPDCAEPRMQHWCYELGRVHPAPSCDTCSPP